MTITFLDIIAIGSLFGALTLLLSLAIIDLRTFLLPNILVAPFALLAPLFHAATGFYYLSPFQLALGGCVAFLILYIIRAIANRYYGQDALGLGDVKLLGAAGFWLGTENVMMALTIGAFAGLIHGLAYALFLKIITKKTVSLRRLVIPAGPGFIIGIILTGGWFLSPFLTELWLDLIH